MSLFRKELLKRIRNKYTYQAQFARDIDVDRASVTQWISGKAYPSMGNLIRICRVFSWDLKEAEELINSEKKLELIRTFNETTADEQVDTESVLINFLSLPLQKQKSLLREIVKIHNQEYSSAVNAG